MITDIWLFSIFLLITGALIFILVFFIITLSGTPTSHMLEPTYYFVICRPGVRLSQCSRMLWSSQLLEHPQALATVGHPHPTPLLWPLASCPPQHPGLRLAREEVPLRAERKLG